MKINGTIATALLIAAGFVVSGVSTILGMKIQYNRDLARLEAAELDAKNADEKAKKKTAAIEKTLTELDAKMNSELVSCNNAVGLWKSSAKCAITERDMYELGYEDAKGSIKEQIDEDGNIEYICTISWGLHKSIPWEDVRKYR